MPPEPTAHQRAARDLESKLGRLYGFRVNAGNVVWASEAFDEITAALDAEFARGRRAGLEEGAKVAYSWEPSDEEYALADALAKPAWDIASEGIAAALRQAAESPQPS